MRILVIGGTGFIGPAVVRNLLQLGHTVAVFHRGSGAGRLPTGVARIVGDRHALGDHREAIRRFAPDLVVDMILSSRAQAEMMMRTVRGIARRVVALSSMDVYRAVGVLHGSEPGPLEPVPLTEDSPLRTKLQTYPPDRLQALRRVFGWIDDAYDKIPVEQAVLGDGDLPGTVLRLPMVYGPGDPLHRFFPVLKRMDDGRAAILFSEEVAAWRGTRGYIDNVAAAVALATSTDQAIGRIYNVGEELSRTELEWAEALRAHTGWPGRFVLLPRHLTPPHLLMPGNLAQHWTARSRRIRDELGYREPVPAEEALAQTVAWERTNAPTFDPQQFDYAAEDASLGPV